MQFSMSHGCINVNGPKIDVGVICVLLVRKGVIVVNFVSKEESCPGGALNPKRRVWKAMTLPLSYKLYGYL